MAILEAAMFGVLAVSFSGGVPPLLDGNLGLGLPFTALSTGFLVLALRGGLGRVVAD